MLIVCPSCASEYMIDPARLGGEGRTVRCAVCKSTWFVTAAGRDRRRPTLRPARSRRTRRTPMPPKPLSKTPHALRTNRNLRASRASRRCRTGRTPGRRSLLSRPAARARRACRPWPAVAGAPRLPRAGCRRLGTRSGRARGSRDGGALCRHRSPVNLRGLDVPRLRSEVVGAGTDAVLVVEGEIVNNSGRDAAVPAY